MHMFAEQEVEGEGVVRNEADDNIVRQKIPDS